MNLKWRLLIFLLLVVVSAKAQHWAGGEDDESWHITYTAQYNVTQFQVFKSPEWQQPFSDANGQVTTALNGIYTPHAQGFGIGLGLSKNISDRTEIRLVPSFVLNDRVLTYRYQPGNGAFRMERDEIEKQVRGALIELPLAFKLKSDRRKDFRAYLVAGGKYSINMLTANSKQDNNKIALEKLLRNQNTYFSYEAGLGFDIFFEYFKLSPEIKYGATLGNILKQQNTAFSTPIDQLKLRQVTFSLYIQ